MKRVAIIAPDFAPSSLPPATRVRFFSRHLPEFGWKPIIITTKPEFYEAPVDFENERLLLPSLEVIRTNAFRTKWTRKIGVGDVGMRGLWHHWRALSRLHKEKRIDLVFIPVPPYVPMMLGRLAHMRFDIPYVVDYIDPWVTDFYWQLPKEQRPPKWPLADALARTLEPFAMKRVAHVTGVSKGTTDGVISRYSWLSHQDGTEIPYGGESTDFEYIRQHPRHNGIFPSEDGLLHLSYVGVCIPAMHASVRALFAAARLGLNRTPELFGRLRLHFVGTSYAANGSGPHDVLALAREAQIESQVTEHAARIPYLDSLQVMVDSHALFLVGSDEPHYTASKVFPYILAKRQLLAIFNEESSAVRILRETGACSPVTFNSQLRPADRVAKISAQLEHILELPRDYRPDTNWESFERYTAKAMAARLAESFDRVAISACAEEESLAAAAQSG